MMQRNQIPLFATLDDLAMVINEVSRQRPIKSARMGLFDQPLVATLVDEAVLEPFKAYLFSDADTNLLTRRVSQRDGEDLFSVDQLENPNSVVISCGGYLSPQSLVAGQIGTAAANEKSKQLFSVFSKVIRQKFEKIKSYYAGPEAVRLLDDGARLMPSLKSPPEYDLSR